VETADAPPFERLMQRHVPGADATYWTEERLGVELPTEEDEVLFRLWMLWEDTIGDIHRVGDLLYLVAPRLADDVRRCIEQDAFEGAAAPLTLVGLAFRGGGVLRSLEAALDDARPSFAGQPPVLCPV
jgi:hypothetical protein